MSILSKFRIPYKDDSLFGLLFSVALLIPLAFDVYNFESFEIIKFGLLMLIIGFACLVFFKKYFNPNAPSLVLRGSPVFFLGLAAFLFWALLTSLLAADKNYSFFGFYPRFTNGFLFYLLWSILFFLLAALNKEQLWRLIKVIFFCSGLVGLWALLESVGFGYYNGLAADFFVRSAPSFLGNPNFSSMFMAALAPIGLYFFYASKSFWTRVYYAISLFLQIWAIVILASRGAIAALLIGVMVCIILGLISRQAGLYKFSLACFIYLFIIFALSQGFLNFVRPGAVTSTINLSESNIQTRLGVWRLALDSIVKKPIVGWGLGNFELVFEHNRAVSSLKTGFFDDPHNLFLYLAATGGLPFLALFLFLVCYPAWRELKKLFKNTSSQPLETVCLLGAISAWLAAAFFTPVAVPCYVILAFLISGLLTESHSFTMPKAALFRMGGKVLAGAFVAYAVCFIAAEHLFFAGIRIYNNGNFLKAHSLVKAAVYLNPVNNLYYEYLAGSAIRSNFSVQDAEKNILAFSRFHRQRSYTYAQLANIYYILYYQTHNLQYKTPIYQNLNKAIALDPLSTNNYFLFSQYQFIFGDLGAAAQSVQQGLNLTPKNLEATMFLAKIYQYQGNREMLIKTLQTAVPTVDNQTKLANLLKLARTMPNLNELPLNINFSVGRLD